MATEAAGYSRARSRKPEASKKFQGKHLADAENKNLWGVTQHWIHGHCWRPHGPGGELRIRHPHSTLRDQLLAGGLRSDQADQLRAWLYCQG